MSSLNLLFETVSPTNTIYDPIEVGSTALVIQVTNAGSEALTGLGLYLTPSTSLGDVDALANELPATDWQDIVYWGDIDDGGAAEGVTVVVPQNSGPDASYRINSSQGHSWEARIPFKDLGPGDVETFTVQFNGIGATRRLYVDLVLEN